MMNVIKTMRDLFSSETIVWITKEGGYKASQHNKVLGRMYRWIYPHQYIDCTTVWKAHRELNTLVKTCKGGGNDINIAFRLDQLKDACTQLKGDESKLFVARMGVVVAKIFNNVPAQGDSVIAANVEEYISLFIHNDSPTAADRERCVRSLRDKKDEAAKIIARNFFEPVVLDILSRRKPQDFLKGCALLQDLSRDFGGDAFLTVMNAHHFHEHLKKDFFIPLVTGWISDFNKKKPDVVDRLHELQNYFSAINYSRF